MHQVPDIKMIRASKAAALAELSMHEAEVLRRRQAIERLKAQILDFDTAERVLVSLGAKDAEFDKAAAPHQADEQLAVVHETEGVQKPPGTPPMPEMIMEALNSARRQGHGHLGLEPTEMLTYIQAKWWPQATLNNVGPIAWRMWKRGQLEKLAGLSRYRLAGIFAPEGE